MGPELASWSIVLAVIFILLLFLNGVFTLVEGSLRRLRPGRLEEQAEEGSEIAEALLEERDHWDRYIRTMQLCRVICVLFLGILIAWPLISWVDEMVQNIYIAYGVIFVAVGFVWLTFSILIPDGIASVRSERTAVILLWFARLIGKLFLPLTGTAYRIAAGILKAIGITPQMQEAEAHSEEELRQIVSASQRGGVIDEVEEELIDNVLDFTDRVVREIMIPRQDMAVIYLDEPLEEQLATVKENPHTRFPLCMEDKDHVLGMLHIRDLLVEIMNTEISKIDIQKLQREVLVVPEGMQVSELLDLMRGRQIHLAVVVDEYGGTAGLVALEDILEELVGEINDEHDADITEEIQELSDGKYELDGRVMLEDVSDLLDLEFDEEPEEETIGGYLFRLLGRKPEEGDQVEVQHWQFTVIETEGFRIHRILVSPLEPVVEEENHNDN